MDINKRAKEILKDVVKNLETDGATVTASLKREILSKIIYELKNQRPSYVPYLELSEDHIEFRFFIKPPQATVRVPIQLTRDTGDKEIFDTPTKDVGNVDDR